MGCVIRYSNPIKVFLHGSVWIAIVGGDMASAQAGFGRSPEQALENLLAIEGVLES